MVLADYHLHSRFSFDGKEELSNLCERAVALGLCEIAVTDHLDIIAGAPYDWQLDTRGLFAALEKVQEAVRDRLIVRKGIELGQPQHNPEAAARFFLDTPGLDFVIGSIHNLENNKDVDTYDFAVENHRALYDRYLDALLLLAEQYDYDVLGHLTYPFRYMAEAGFAPPDIMLFSEKLRRLFSIVIGRGKGVELNVSGLRQKIAKPFPPFEMMALYRKMGGRIVTVGTDAHCLEHMGQGLEDGYWLLREAGFSEITVFEHRKAVFLPIG